MSKDNAKNATEIDLDLYRKLVDDKQKQVAAHKKYNAQKNILLKTLKSFALSKRESFQDFVAKIDPTLEIKL